MATTKHWRIDLEAKLEGSRTGEVLTEITRAMFPVATGTLDEYAYYGLAGKNAPISPAFEQIETGNIFDTGNDGGLLIVKNLSTSVNLLLSGDFGNGSRKDRRLLPGQLQIVDYYESSALQLNVSGVGAVCPYLLFASSVP